MFAYAGRGFLTLKIKKVYAYFLPDGTRCDDDITVKCDPYIKLFIDDKLILQTERKDETSVYDVNVIYESKQPIPKTTTIKIEVWDYDSFLNGADDLVQDTEGNIESFLIEPVREGIRSNTTGFVNLIESFVIWKDEKMN